MESLWANKQWETDHIVYHGCSSYYLHMTSLTFSLVENLNEEERVQEKSAFKEIYD